MSEKKAGRPIGTVIKYDATTLAFISKRIIDGATEGQVAKELGISAVAFSNHKGNTPELEDTIKQALTYIESEVVGFLMKMIRNPDHKNHASSVYFYLKTRCKWRENDPTPSNIIAPDGMKFRLIAEQDMPKVDETE